MARSYGVDVSSFQPSDMSKYKSLGASFSIVKVSEGTSYKNPLATGQIASTKAHGMIPMGYFFATFSGNSTMAGYNADYAVSVAKAVGLPIGSYLAVDWESRDGNVITGNSVYNTQAILTAMNKIKQAGFKPLFYSGASAMKNNVNTKTIVSKYPNSLWVAQYPISGAVNQPDFNYFPSLDGVLIWQFTDNWCGAGVDGNVAVLDLNGVTTESVDDEMSWHPEVKYNQLGAFKVNRKGGANLYDSSKLEKVIGTKNNSEYTVYRAKDGAVLCGKLTKTGQEQWFSQADGLTKINPLATNSKAHAWCKVIDDNTYTQNVAKPAPAVKKAPKRTEYQVYGRTGKYLYVSSNENDGHYLDGDKCNIVL